MPDLQDQPARNAADPATPATTTSDPGAESPGVDHLAHLFTMSTTSAAAATEYAAINTTSVIALLMGLASVVALYDWLLLLVPALAVVVGIVAMVQIARSNGTQTGRSMAVAGVVLGLLLGAVVGARAVAEAARTRADREAIAALMSTVGQKVGAGDYDAAYALFSDKFKTYVTRDKFVQEWSRMQADVNGTGRIQSFTWNGRAVFDKTAAGVPVAGAGSDWRWEKYPQPLFYQMYFIKPGDTWLVDSIPSIFKLPRKKRGAAANAPADAAQSPDASQTPAEDTLAPGGASPSSANDPAAQ